MVIFPCKICINCCILVNEMHQDTKWLNANWCNAWAFDIGSKFAGVVIICHGDDSQLFGCGCDKKQECMELYFQSKLSGANHTEIWYIVFLLLYDFSFISILFSDVIFWFLWNILYKEILLKSLRFGKIKKKKQVRYIILQYMLDICSLHKKYTDFVFFIYKLHKHSVVNNTIIWYNKNILSPHFSQP